MRNSLNHRREVNPGSGQKASQNHGNAGCEWLRFEWAGYDRNLGRQVVFGILHEMYSARTATTLILW
jgi:hypothetical protein